jgi:AAA+ superfamily predicted ATPase
MQMKSFTHRVVPKISMEELILSSALRERLDAVINFEKARAVLLGQWGFEQERLGTACLFWGPHGTGKSAAAEAVGFELGRPLKVVNCAQLISRESSTKTGSNITSTFKDSRLMDAVLVLEDFQVF